MDFQDFTAEADDAGRRMDRIARRLLPNHPLGMIYSYFRKGLVKRNHKKTVPDARVAPGDTISIAAFLMEDRQGRKPDYDDSPDVSRPPQPSAWPPILESIETVLGPDLFCNAHLRVINKPYGFPVQGGGTKTSSSSSPSLDKLIVKEYLERRRQQGLPPALSFTPGPLHRLDRRTTGVLVFSQSLAGARWFSQTVRDHTVRKEYLAIVEGVLSEPQHWTESIGRESGTTNGNFARSSISAEGKNADTLANPVAWGNYRGKEVTLLHLLIGTGRSHQIRLHCSHHGLPLLGDTAYGGMAVDRKISGGQELFLHAWRLQVPEDNPVGMPAEIRAPLPDNFQNMLEHYLPETDVTRYII